MIKVRSAPYPAYWRATALLAIGEVVNYGDRAAISSVLPALRADLGLSDIALGVLGSIFLWSYAISSPITGRLADSYSRNIVAIISLTAWSGITVVTGFSGGIVTLCLLRGALGVSESLYIPTAVALIADYHRPSNRARAMSLLNIGSSVGAVLGSIIAGFIAVHFGWRAVFFILGAGGLALALIFIRSLPVVPTAVREDVSRPRLSESIKLILCTPSFIILLAKTTCFGVALWIFASWLPLYFYDTFRMTLISAGFAGTFLTECSSLIGLALGAWISDIAAARSARNRMLLQGLSTLTAALSLSLFTGGAGFLLVVIALLCFGFCCGFSNANDQAILCDIVPSRFRSTAVGIMNMCSTGAGGIAVLLAGVGKAHFRLNMVFAGAAIPLLAAAVALFYGYGYFVTGDIARAHDFDALNSAHLT